MALTLVAQERQDEVTQWARREMDTLSYMEFSKQSGITAGALVRQRLLMLVGQSSIPDVDGVHIFDSDDNWSVFEREMKIPLGAYYCHADMDATTGWGLVMYYRPAGGRSMEGYFYKTLVVYVNNRAVFRPLAFHQPAVTAGFPSYGTDDGASWSDAVLERLGLCGGEHTLDGDVSLKKWTVAFDPGSTHNIDPASAGTAFGLGYRGAVRSDVEIIGVPTSEFARVEYGDAVEFVPGADPVTFHFTVIAEDDTELGYSVTIREAQ